MESAVPSPFLKVPEAKWVCANDLCFAIFDSFPVSPGHALVITRRVVPTFFECTAAEQQTLMALVCEAKALLDGRLNPKPDGYNVGFNAGAAAWMPRRRPSELANKLGISPLQWGRGLDAAETLQVVRLLEIVASLQWGRGLDAAETPAISVFGVGHDCASMGPRLGCRGDLSRHRRPGGCNGRFNGAAAWMPRRPA